MWKDVITLRTESSSLDSFNRPYKTFTDRRVQAHKMSVRFSEFYQAAATGLKPELIFAVKSFKNETYLMYKGKQYRIIRTFEKGDITELTCTSLLNDSEIYD